MIATSSDPVGPITELKEYAFALNSDESDPVGRTRGIVVVCRKSGQRREDLESVLITGNSANAWGIHSVIRVVQLLLHYEIDHVILRDETSLSVGH